jgi:hypothetical protein
MSDTPATIAQPKAEDVKSGLDLLSQDRRFLEDNQIITPKTEEPPVVTKPEETPLSPIIEPTAEEKAAQLKELTDLGLTEGATKEQIEEAKVKAEEAKKADTWTLDTVQEVVKEQEGLGWKELANTFAEKAGVEVPAEIADTEEAYLQFQIDTINKIREEAQKYNIDQELSKFTPEQRLIIDLNKAGVSIQEYNKPFVEVAQLKALDDTALVRRSYEIQPGWTEEMVEVQMQKVIDSGHLSVEAQIARTKLDNYEKSIITAHQEQLQQYTVQQQQVQAQKRNQEAARVKIALDKVPTFMGRKIDDKVKDFVFQELTSGKYDNMPGTPEEKVDYAYYKMLGKKGIEHMRARVLEELTLEQAKKQHNVAPVITGGANRVTQPASEVTDGMKAALEDPRFK